MNSGLVGALGSAPLKTSLIVRRNYQGVNHTYIPLTTRGAFVVGNKGPGDTVYGQNRNRRGIGSVDFGSQGSADEPLTEVASGIGSFRAGNGGGASGAYSVLFSSNAGFGAVASGEGSFLRGGLASSASGLRSFASGERISATADYSHAVGYTATASRMGELAFSGGYIYQRGQGTSQGGVFTMLGQTIGAQTFRMVISNSTFSGGGSFRVPTIPTGHAMLFFIMLTATQTNGSKVSHFFRRICLKNASGTTTVVGSEEAIGTDLSNGLIVNSVADDTNDCLGIDVTGIISEDWVYSATVMYNQNKLT